MKTSTRGINLIKTFESFRAAPYLCSAGIPTIGFGHTSGVTMNTSPITMSQAVQFLQSDLAKSEKAINSKVRQPLNQNQFDALASFIFNVGVGAFNESTLLRELNTLDYTGAANELLRWNKAGGKVLNGLTRRREAERNLFLSLV